MLRGSCVNEFVVIDNIVKATSVLKQLLEMSEVCLNFGGLILASRSSTLTSVAISAVGTNAVSYVFDVAAIGKSSLFHSSPGGLKSLLESQTIRKIVYDCRTAADVLFHQFQITLQHTLELQVYLQAIQMVKGTHCRQDLPTLEDVKHLYVDFATTENLRADPNTSAHAAFQCLLVNYV